MPELPEVETVRKGLLSWVGSTLVNVTTYDLGPNMITDYGVLEGQTLQSIDRHGKYLFLRFDTDTLLIHLRMTGQFVEGNHVRLRLNFDNGTLPFNDVRKFADVRLQHYVDMAPDAMVIEYDTFAANLTGGRSVKVALLDQNVVAGIGNIYACEMCYLAGVHPTTPCKELSEKTKRALYDCMKPLLQAAMQHEGTTFDSYLNVNGKAGSFLPFLNVFNKTVCPKGHNVKKIKLGGRGTYYCACQQSS